MSGNYGSVEDAAERGETKPRIPYKFKSVKEYHANKSLLTIEPSGFEKTDDVPEQLQAVGVTVEAWGEFAADMRSAVNSASFGKSLYCPCGCIGWLGVIFLMINFDAFNAFVVIAMTFGFVSGYFCFFRDSMDNIVEKQLDLSCEKMGMRCDATLSAVSTGGYPSTDPSESHPMSREKKDSEGRVIGHESWTEYDPIPKHYQFTTIEKGRPVKKQE
jgi:hypothetical protein